MIADASILQVWLDSQPTAAQIIVVPYVQSARDMQLTYRMSVSQHGRSGNSMISQGDNVNAIANKPTALSRIAVSNQKDGECTIELTLLEKGQDIGNYRFDCPK